MSSKASKHNFSFRPAVFLTGLCLSAAAIAQNSGQFDDAFRAMKRDGKLQFELPERPPPPKLDWLEGVFKALGGFIKAILPLLEILFWGGLALIIGSILYFIGREIYNTRLERQPKKAAEDAPPPLYTPDQDQARILLDDIDAMAAEGRFEEAVHTLLFRSIQDIDIRRPNTIRRSLTSREIAALEILTPATRETFAKIGAVVETSYFGGQKIGRAEFDICREAYAQFARKETWKAAA